MTDETFPLVEQTETIALNVSSLSKFLVPIVLNRFVSLPREEEGNRAGIRGVCFFSFF